MRNGESPVIAHCRLGVTAVATPSDNFPSLASPGESQTASGDHPSAHQPGWGRARRPRAGGDGGRSAGTGRSARPRAGLTAPSVSHRATGSPRKEAASRTATGLLGAVARLLGGVPSQPPVTRWKSLNAQQVPLQ